MIIVFAALGTVFLLAAIHPFITYPLSLELIRFWRRRAICVPRNDASTPAETFAICFCAYNEEHIVHDKMRNLLALRERTPNLEILVYVDAASDRTAELLASYGDRIKLHVSPHRLGKTHGMNLLVKMAQSSIVVFTDANVMLAEDALVKLQRYFADPAIGCVGGHLIYTNGGQSVTAATGSLYWRLEERIKQLESETGSAMGADGSLFAIRRSLHQPAPDHACDDMFVSFAILCDGSRVVSAPDVKAYEESVSASREEFQRKIRIGCHGFTVHRLLWPRIRRLDALTLYKYVSHKLLRWVSAYCLALSVLAFEVFFALSGHAAFFLVWGLVGALAILAGGRYGVSPLVQLKEILAALVATAIGVWRSLRGQHFQTWTPASSIRK